MLQFQRRNLLPFNMVRIAQLFIFLFALLFLSLLIIGGRNYLHSQQFDARSENLVSNEKTKLTICGWIPWWDFEESWEEFTENEKMFTSAFPLVFILGKDGQITLKVENLEEKTSNSNLTTIPSIYNEFDGERVSVIINSPKLSEKHIEEIVNLAEKLNVNGVEIDYEYLFVKDKDAYSEFVKTLAEKLHDNNKTLSITLHPKISEKANWDGADAQDWFELGKHADYLVIMAYDYHWGNSDAGAIAPLSWFQKVLKYAKSKIPNEKIVIGIGMYGYDWEDGTQEGKPLTLSEIDELLEKYEVGIQYDEKQMSPFAKYMTGGVNHTIWFENELSVISKIESVRQFNLSNICIWRIGGIPAHFYELLYHFALKI